MKKIKFNLHTNGVGVANLEDLQEHFNIDDILEHYKSGLLQKWLEVQGLHEELEKINNLSKEDKKLIPKILDIFEIKHSKEDIRELELSRSYLQDKQRFLEEFKQSENDFNQSLESYFSEFRSTLYQIIENPNNKAIIKANLKRLANDFWPLTLMNFKEIFVYAFGFAPLAILLSLSFKKFRAYFEGWNCFENNYHDNFKNICLYEEDKYKNHDGKKAIVEHLSTIDIKQIGYLTFSEIKERLEEARDFIRDYDFAEEDIWQDEENYGLSEFSGDTNGYWKDLVPKTKKVLVLSISEGSLICAPINSNEIPKELDSEAVNGKFLILDGLQFKSNNADYSVTYLEI